MLLFVCIIALVAYFSKKIHYEDSPPQGLSEARRGREGIRIFLLLIRRGDVLSGEAVLILHCSW